MCHQHGPFLFRHLHCTIIFNPGGLATLYNLYRSILLQVPGMTCKTCSQSSASLCSSLTSLFKTNSGVAAAYCNAEFLVIWSSGLPQYDPNNDNYLNSVPLPAGDGTGSCRVRVALPYLTVYKIPLAPSLQTGANTVPNPLPG